DGSKLREITNTLKNALSEIASSLSEMPGTLGEIGKQIGFIANNADSLSTMLDENAEKSDRNLAAIEMGINGLTNLFSMVAGQIAENKELQEQWNEKIREAAHQAALARIELQAYQEGNIFGVENPYAKAIAGAAEYAASIQELQKMA